MRSDSPDIKKIIARGEGISVEFKKAEGGLPQSLFQTICAFLNRNGGAILLGVADDGTVVGIDPDKAERYRKEISNLSNNPQKLFPSFLLDSALVEQKGKTVLYLYVPVSSQVHRCDGKVYDRSADGDYEVRSDEQIKNIYSRKSAYYSESTIYPYLQEKHFVPGIVDRARSLMKLQRDRHPWTDLSDAEFFTASGLWRADMASGLKGFTLAALLLFGREEHIISAVPHYKTDALLRKVDLDRYDDRITLRCNLIDAYDALMNFVAKHLPDPFYLEGTQRISLRDRIFREIVVNFLIHREYMNAHPATLIIYKDRLETKNANKPHTYGPLHPGNFEPFPKNPNIAKVFSQLGMAEELGTGIRKVYKYIKAYSGSDKVEFSEEDLFVVKVPLLDSADGKKSKDLEKDLEKDLRKDLEESLSPNQKKILRELLKNGRLTQKELSRAVGITEKNIRNNIKYLKEKGLLQRVGPDKGGYWKVIMKENP